ncbi:MAG: hypothetical protein IPH58_05815 [Sphingobacteriales bacterium]|jgi:hypothetical protein|nr:hypothetical protein [Sphingobacteriales bacterium]
MTIKTAFIFSIFVFITIKSFSQFRPNIVFIVSDDQRMEGTIHHLGGKEVITPNLDALAKSGTAFMNAYIMGGMAHNPYNWKMQL